MAGLREMLAGLLAVPGVRAAVLVGREGLPIEAVGQDGERFFEALGALGASALGTAEALGGELGQGHVVRAVLQYSGAQVDVEPLGPYAAVVTLSLESASLGAIHHLLEAHREELLRALDLH